MKIIVFVIIFLIGLSTTFVSSKIGFDFFTVFILASLISLAAVVHKAAFRSNKLGLFGIYTNFKSVTSMSFTKGERALALGCVILFLATCLSLLIRV